MQELASKVHLPYLPSPVVWGEIHSKLISSVYTQRNPSLEKLRAVAEFEERNRDACVMPKKS